jgi:hypothetical protein
MPTPSPLLNFLASEKKTSLPPIGTVIGAPPSSIPAPALSPLVLARQGLMLSPLPKRWQFLTLVADELIWGAGFVHLGYITQFFSHLCLRTERACADQRLELAVPGIQFTLSEHALHGLLARYRNPLTGSAFSMQGNGCDLQVSGRAKPRDFSIDARIQLPQPEDTPTLSILGATRNPTWISSVKSALFPLRGTLKLGARSFSLDGGFAGLDCTVGFPPRNTKWFWAYGMGPASDGTRSGPVAFNLARGNNLGGQNECALWWDGKIFELPPVTFQKGAQGAPWKITGPGMELRFHEFSRLSNFNRLGLVRSDLAQAYGEFEGTITVPDTDKTISLERLAGICEDQDVLW